MELKTVKEINLTGISGCSRCESIGEACGMCDRKRLKQEAIKWVKRFLADYPTIKFSDIIETYSPIEENKEHPFGFRLQTISNNKNCCGLSMIALLKHFFNITEEDLK